MAANDEQIEYWNSDEATHWVDHADRYDGMLEPYIAPLLATARVGEASRVLDVGCGTGSTTIAAARVATSGDVLGIDISAPMLEKARAKADAAGVGNVAFEQGDAQAHSFPPDDRDAMLSRFGVMFFDDPVAAFTNLASTARSGCRLAFVCWQEMAVNEWVLVPGTAALAHVPPPDPAPEPRAPDTPGPFAFADAGRVRSILSASGWSPIEITAIDHPILLGGGGDVDDAVAFLRGTGMAKILFADAGPAETERALEAVREALTPYATSEGVRMGAAAWLVTATK